MDNFIISIEAIIPMFSMLVLGVMVKKLKLLNDSELTSLNSMIFKALFPILMFANIYGTKIEEAFNFSLIVYAVSAILIVYVITTLVVLKIEKSNAKRGAMIQAIYRSNFVLIGLPIAVNLVGDGNVGTTAIMVAIIVPLYNVLAVLTLECYRGGKVSFKKIVLGIIKNPLILGSLVGIAVMLLKIQLPSVVEKTVSQISAAATPMALIVLGASFNIKSVEEGIKDLSICVIGRLIIVPAVILSIAALIGIRDIAFITLIGIFASPCAVSSYTMAQQMDSDADLAGNTVIFTSALACFTMFVWIFLFKQLGMF